MTAALHTYFICRVRPTYSSSGCSPAEPDSASVGGAKVQLIFQTTKFRAKKQPNFCPLENMSSKTA